MAGLAVVDAKSSKLVRPQAGVYWHERYREHAQRGSHILLFVRRRKQDDRRATAPYTFLVPATCVTHHGELPMPITWRLQHAMPAELFEEMKLAAG